MDLRQLEYFASVANAGSFTRASLKLAVDQPALSKQIRRLEVELKLALFRRNGRGIALTEAGTVLLAHATKILEEVEETRRALDAVRGETAGRLAIAMPAVAKKVVTTDFINAFRSRFPRASLEIIEGKSRMIQDWLIDGRIDIGLVHGSPLRPGIEIVRHTQHELYLLSPRTTRLFRPGASVPFRDLQKLPLILPAAPHSIRMLLDAQAAKLGIALNVVLQVEGAQFILDLIQQGHGYTVLPAFSVTMRNMSEALQQNEIVQPRLTRALSVAISSQRPVTRVARESIELLEQYLVA